MTLVVDARVEAELFDDVRALLGAAGQADRAAFAHPASWPTTPPTAPLAALTQTVSPVFGPMILLSPYQPVTPGMPTRAEVGRQRNVRGIDLAQHARLVAVHHRVLLPSAHAHHLIARL